MRVRIGCLHFVKKINGKSRTIQPRFDQSVSIFQPFLRQKNKTKINNHLGLSMFDIYSKNPYKAKKTPTSTSMNWGVQLNMEFTYNFWFTQHAIQPTLNRSLGPCQANLFSEKYNPIVLQWLGPPQPSNSFKESWKNLSHKVFVWRFFFMKPVFVQTFIVFLNKRNNVIFGNTWLHHDKIFNIFVEKPSFSSNIYFPNNFQEITCKFDVSLHQTYTFEA